MCPEKNKTARSEQNGAKERLPSAKESGYNRLRLAPKPVLRPWDRHGYIGKGKIDGAIFPDEGWIYGSKGRKL